MIAPRPSRTVSGVAWYLSLAASARGEECSLTTTAASLRCQKAVYQSRLFGTSIVLPASTCLYCQNPTGAMTQCH
jgi:hypothetical protein